MTDIMNAALLIERMDEIDTSQSLPEHRVLSKNWPMIVEAELEAGNYHFTKEEETLLTRTTGQFGFEDAYQLPQRAMFVRKVRLETTSGGSRWEPDWVQDDRYVYLDSSDGVIVEYAVVPDVSFWTANFVLGIRMRLQAVILRIKEEKSEAAQMDQMAEMQLQKARTASTKQRRAAESYKPSKIALARHGRA